ncbi:MAG TPA: type II toxin-antitoxin system RatA family toxin [Rhizobiales bacterium]|nr:type II toxin-antitoxin system RatA family toxin [Hyphomicrobiales bacterium]
MPKRRIIHRVPQSAEQMFALVADVESYPEFLPWCSGLRVLSRENHKDHELLTADMTIGYKIFKEVFRSQVTLNRAEKHIKVHYIKGPFRRLDNNWRFADLPDKGSEIEFYIDFELRRKGLNALVGGLFEHTFMRLLSAFEGRARQIYPS